MVSREKVRRQWLPSILLATCVFLGCLPSVGWAQVSYSWIGGPGTQDWGNAAHWSPSTPPGPPNAGDSALLYVGDDSAKVANYYNIFAEAPLLGGVYINSGPAGSMTLLLEQAGLAGQLRANEVIVGDKVQGQVEQRDGTLTVAGTLDIGNPVGSNGTYTMTGGVLDTANTYVGNFGTGDFYQNGGAHTVANELNLGYQAGSNGTYNLEGGTVNSQLLFVGYNGGGFFHQNGGDVVIIDHLGVGREAGSTGEYNLNNGTFTTSNLYVGYGGTGTFNKNGGTLTVNGFISMAETATGNATFNLGSGSLAATNLDVGLNGVGEFNQSSDTTLTIGSGAAFGILGVNSQAGVSIFNQHGGDTTVFGNIEVGRETNSQGQYYLHGGTLTVHDSLYLGYQGTGMFTQTAGTLTIANYINLGDRPTGNGVYNLEGGSVTAQDLFVGTAGVGLFNQSGETSNATFNNSLNLVNGIYDLSGGNLIAHNINVGDGGTGTFNQSGSSTVTISNYLGIGRNAGDIGTFELTGGTVSFSPAPGAIGTMFLGVAGSGVFNQYGGTVDLTGGTLQIGVETGGIGTYNLSGGQLQVGTLDLAVVGPAIPGTGVFNLSETGILTAETINLNPGGTFNQTGGTLNYTTFNHQGGDVLGDLENRGAYNYTGGTFSGRLLNYGTVNFAADFTAGNGMAHLGAAPVTLGGVLNVTCNGLGLEVDQGAVFNQTGGTLTSTDTIIGNTGEGTFNQSGGTHTVTNPTTLILGAAEYSIGTYNLENGILQTNNTIVGNFGSGIFNQTGGSHNVTNDLSLGRELFSDGIYSLEGGTLSTLNTYLGYAGIGGFQQTGADTVHTVGNALVLGQELGGAGAYSLENGQLNTAYTMVGINGPGAFQQTGGTHTITLGMGLAGIVDTSYGVYELQNGNLIITGVPATSTGGFLDIGETGEAAFSQTGGTLQVYGSMNLGVYAGSLGEYQITGGTLEVLNAYVPPNPDPVIYGDMFVGDNGTGIFTQSGINTTVTVNNHLGIGRGQNGEGEYNLDGGQLTTGYLFVGNQGTGVFNHGAATHTITGSGYVGSDTTGTGIYNLNQNGILNVTDSFEVGNPGTGTFNQYAGSTFTTGGLFVGDGVGFYNQYGGDTTVAEHLGVGRSAGGNGQYLLQGGNLTVGDLFVGYEGTGTFRQTGGTHQVNCCIHVGHENTGIGTYLLENGNLFGQHTQVGINGTGIFSQSGGIHTLTGDLTLAANPGSQGTYNLTGGDLTAANIFLNAGGLFNRTGGNLAYTTFYHQGGEVQGNLVNQSAYIYDGGLFSGRLLNYGAGTVTFNADFIAADGLAHHSSNAITLADNRSLTFNGQGLTVDQGAIFNQTGGSLNTTDSIIGNTGVGTFDQTGGSHTISNALTLAATAGSTGTYNLQGGTLTAPAINVNAGGTLNQTGGTLIPTNACSIAPGGSFSQTDGIVDGTSNTIFLTEGTCTLSDNGTLRPGGIMRIAPGGSFTQNGGILDGLSNTTLITEGIFNLNNGTVRPGNALVIQNGGVFNQLAGLFDGTSNTISIFAGTCTLDGGTYNAGILNLYTGGSFHWNGGDFSYNTLNLQGGNFYGDLNNLNLISGYGTITGNVTNQGNVSPGNSPGVLNIVGSFTQTAAGTYITEIASATSYDQINVTGNPGTATVDGTLTPVLLGGYTPSWNQVFPGIVNASGGVFGTFSDIDSILTWRVRYNQTSIDLIAGNRNFADPAFHLTPNQLNVGNMLNQIADTATGDLGVVLTNLAELPDNAVGSAYQQITPDKASTLPALSLAGSMMQGQSIANRLSYQRWRQGGSPTLAGGRPGSFSLSYNNLAGLMLAYNSADLSGLMSSSRMQPGSSGNWGFFTDFVSSFGKQDTTTDQIGYDFSIFGFTTGIDYRFREDLVLGLGTGYYHTGATYKGSGGDADINSIPFYAYGAFTPGSFYAQGYVGYTLNLYSMNRDFVFGGINRRATSSVNGNQLNVSLETGYDVKLPFATMTPAASLYYSQAWVDGFTETGAGALNLSVDSQSADSLQTGVGMRLSRTIKTKKAVVLPQVYAFYQHEFANDSRGLNSRLAQTGNTFLFRTNSPSRDFAVLGAGLAVGLKKNLTLQVNYNAEVGRGDYTPHVVSAGLRFEF